MAGPSSVGSGGPGSGSTPGTDCQCNSESSCQCDATESIDTLAIDSVRSVFRSAASDLDSLSEVDEIQDGLFGDHPESGISTHDIVDMAIDELGVSLTDGERRLVEQTLANLNESEIESILSTVSVIERTYGTVSPMDSTVEAASACSTFGGCDFDEEENPLDGPCKAETDLGRAYAGACSDPLRVCESIDGICKPTEIEDDENFWPPRPTWDCVCVSKGGDVIRPAPNPPKPDPEELARRKRRRWLIGLLIGIIVTTVVVIIVKNYKVGRVAGAAARKAATSPAVRQAARAAKRALVGSGGPRP